jgi:DNA-binding CsgD family transcriptional regulator
MNEQKTLMDLNGLKPIELEVLRLVAAERSNQEIASAVDLSVSTIEKMLGNTDRRSIYRKIGVTTRAGASRWYGDHVLKNGDSAETMRAGRDPVAAVVVASGPSRTTTRSLATLSNMSMLALTVLYVSIGVSVFVPVAILGSRSEFLNFYANIYHLVPLVGGLLGLYRQSRSPLPPRHPHRVAAVIFSLALVSWSLGGALWVYGNARGIVVPYPSWPELGYFSCDVMLLAGAYCLVRQVARIGVAWSILLPNLVLAAAVVAVTALLPRQWQLRHADDPVKFVLDIVYPICDAATIILLTLLARDRAFGALSSQMHRAVFVILGGVAGLFAADLGFSIITTLPKDHPWFYYNGSWNGLMFITALWLVAIGTLTIPLEAEADQAA